jgi:hypothetical protein
MGGGGGGEEAEEEGDVRAFILAAAPCCRDQVR